MYEFCWLAQLTGHTNAEPVAMTCSDVAHEILGVLKGSIASYPVLFASRWITSQCQQVPNAQLTSLL